MIGNIKAGIELKTGKNFVTGEEIPDWVRGVSAIGMVVPWAKNSKHLKHFNKVATPRMKESKFGLKISDDIPNGVPRNWKKTEISDAIIDYKTSIVSRKKELAFFDKVGGGSAVQRKAHARRIGKEESFVKSLDKAKENQND